MVSMFELQAFVRSIYNPNGVIGPDGVMYNPDGSVDNRIMQLQPYTYRLNFDNIAPETTQTKNLDIAANADFLILAPYYRCALSYSEADEVDVIPLIDVLIQDTGSNQQFSNDQIDISTYFGQPGKAPYSLPFPRLVNGRSGLSVQINNYGDTDTYARLSLSFSGVLIRAMTRG